VKMVVSCGDLTAGCDSWAKPEAESVDKKLFGGITVPAHKEPSSVAASIFPFLRGRLATTRRSIGNYDGSPEMIDFANSLDAEALANLVDNALRYSPDGGTVTVGATRRQDTVEVSVEDEGIGIPQADQEQIFRKFYRGADAELRAGAGGPGLGLFIARGLVTAMGGRIRVSSEEGEGSRFSFELPAAVAAQAGVAEGRE